MREIQMIRTLSRSALGTILVLFTASFLNPAVAKAGDFDFDSLANIIKSGRVKSVDDLIPLLPDELKSNYTYIRDSLSMQGASDDLPRALLFTNNGKLVLTFNGSEKQMGGNTIEAMQFRSDTRQFEMHEIMFTGGKASFSETNPPACIGCHTGVANLGPRPNWSRYQNWPGLFGSDDDRIVDANDKLLLEQIAQKPRYKSLLHRQDQPLWPYSSVNKGEFETRPNLRISLLLNRLNAQRLAAIFESKKYRPYLPAVLFSSARCDAAADPEVSQDIKEIMTRNPMARLNFNLPTTIPIYDRGNDTPVVQLLSSLGIHPSDFNMAHRNGDYDGRTTLDYGPYFDNDGVDDALPLLASRIADDLAASDPAFASKYDSSLNSLSVYDPGGKYGYKAASTTLMSQINSAGISHTLGPSADVYHDDKFSDQNCQLFALYLKDKWKRDRQKLVPLDPDPGFYPQPSRPEAMPELFNRKCAFCHNGIIAPYIPFSDLKSHLSDHDGYPHGTLADEIIFRLTTQDKTFLMPKLTESTMDIQQMRSAMAGYIRALNSGH